MLSFMSPTVRFESLYRVSKKKCLLPFSAVSIQPTLEIFFVIEIIDKVLSLSKIWRHLVNAKIVKI